MRRPVSRRLPCALAGALALLAATAWSQTTPAPGPAGRPPDYAVPKAEMGGQVGTLPAPLPSGGTPSGAVPPESVRPRDLSQPTPTPPAAPTYTIVLGPRRACAVPRTEKLAAAEGGTIDVETPSPDTLTALLSGTSATSAYLGCHSVSTMTFDLCQEFDITSSEPAGGAVVLALDSTLVGYLRSKHKGGARVTLAQATVAPLGAGCAPLVLAHPPQAVGGTGGHLCNLRLTPLQGPPMPLGRYLLTARFAIEADSGGLCDGHAAADFSPDVTLADPFVRPRDPFQGASKKSFGFNITIKATPPRR